MLDSDRKAPVQALQLYLTQREAEELRDGLSVLLRDPEANKHIHVYDDHMSRELSCSVVTAAKLQDLSRYTKLERRILSEG
ncbi:MAG: hypothetical protein GTO22_19565 [Gemmatimonadales bacterium]|nr:hypothetical protein [Gemmatimonadales bacterium]